MPGLPPLLPPLGFGCELEAVLDAEPLAEGLPHEPPALLVVVAVADSVEAEAQSPHVSVEVVTAADSVVVVETQSAQVSVDEVSTIGCEVVEAEVQSPQV